SARTLGLIIGGLVVLVLFMAFERGREEPLINMKTFSRRPVWTTNLSTLMVGAGMFGAFVLVPQIAQLPEQGGDVGLGMSATQAGLLLMPGSLLMLVEAPVVGRIGETRGSKLPF